MNDRLLPGPMPQGPHWVTITPLHPALRKELSNVIVVAAELARQGDSDKAMRLKMAADELRRLLTESYPDDEQPNG